MEFLNADRKVREMDKGWILKFIKENFSRNDLMRGNEYWEEERVTNLERSLSDVDGSTIISAEVRGTKRYHVSLRMFLNGEVMMYCNCPRFLDMGRCKHIVAVILEYDSLIDNGVDLFPFLGKVDYDGRAQKDYKKPPERIERRDYNTKKLLENYMELSRRSVPETPARLVPRIRMSGMWSYPKFTFRVGYDRLYVVKSISTFMERIEKRQKADYGKGLTLFHGLEQFDEKSQEIIRILMNEFPGYRSKDYYTDSSYSGGARSIENGCAQLTGGAFDQLFELLCGQSVETDIKGEDYFFEKGNPDLSVKLRRSGDYVRMTINMPDNAHVFGYAHNLYFVSGNRLLQCSEDFRVNVSPLLTLHTNEIYMKPSDLSVFCGCVMPAISETVQIESEEGLLEEYIPDECTPYFYFDILGDTLSLKLRFRYEDKEFSAFENASAPGVKRDTIAEQKIIELCKKYFDQTESELFECTDSDGIYDFLTRGIEIFQSAGEVYVSDRLRARHISPSGGKVGLSVSNGLLVMDIDTGEFPPEELEALYQSMLQRRRYHKLPDGRYLTLEGSAYETLAEAVHMLQLPKKDLKKGKVVMPAYRAPYIDSVLREGVRVSRDESLRAMLRNFKSVAENDYVVPDGLKGELRPYQKTGFRWLKTLESCGFGGILADEMGLGKTIQVIAYMLTARRANVGSPNLVVCPASLILNWNEELRRFAPELGVSLVMGTASQRKERLTEAAREGADVVVTSYELLRQDVESYAELEFYCCVLDEGQHIKNQSTLASKAVKRVVCKQRFVLTGTPIENRLSELWNLFDFLMPGYLYSHSAFVERLEKPIIKSGNEEAVCQLRKLVSPFMLRRIKSSVLRDLPPKIEQVRRVQLSDEERKLYLACAAQVRKELESSETGKLNILAALTRLRQVCCDPNLCFENYKGPSSKIETCLELCSGMVSNGHQILLFSQFTSMLDRLRAGLDKLGISCFTLQGSTTKERRAKLVKEFNAGGASVFLISLKAGGTGLNLTAADVVIHYDPWWNQAAQEQGTGRAHRIGQSSTVQVYKLITRDTIEEKILALQERKAKLMDAVSSEMGEGIMSMTKEELMDLLDT